MDNDIGHVRLSLADVVLENAGEVVRVRQPGVLARPDRDEHYEAGVGAQKAQLTRRPAGPADHEIRDAPPLGVVRRRCLGTGRDRLLERLEMRVNVFDVRLVA
jgi:hypothetical protein